MSKNFNIYIKLDKTKYSNQYVIIVDQKVVAAGRDIVPMLKRIHKKFPTKTPFVAKIPEKSVLVLW